MADPTRPDPSHKKLTRPDPGQKILTRTHHYLTVDDCLKLELLPTNLRKDANYNRDYVLIANSLSLVFIPILVLIILNSLIFRTIRKATQRHNAISSHQVSQFLHSICYGITRSKGKLAKLYCQPNLTKSSSVVIIMIWFSFKVESHVLKKQSLV